MEEDKEVKYGARNSLQDKDRLQNIHDFAVENGAECKPKKSVLLSANIDDDLVYPGGSVKAVKVEGGWSIKAPLVVFTNPDDLDVTGEYFDENTDFDVEFPCKSTTYFHHGKDTHFGKKKLNPVTLSKDKFAIWAEGILRDIDDYEAFLISLAKDGKLGMSSGVPGHLVEYEEIPGKGVYIKSWPLGKDASYTHTPAEPKTRYIIPMKSLDYSLASAGAEQEKQEEIEQTVIPNLQIEEVKENLEMELNEEMKSYLESLVASASKATLDGYIESQKEVKSGFVTVSGDEADRALKGNPFTKAGFFRAVAEAELSPSTIDKRLLPLKAPAGINESIPSQGGFLVQQDINNSIMEKVWEEGSLLSFFNPVEVQGNGMTFHWVDETSRADGYRAGGVRGYWMAEAGDITASQPKIRDIELKLKKLAALVYVSDEFLEDVGSIESWINIVVPKELRFMLEASIYAGNGNGQPVGFLNSDALISAVRTDASEIDAYDLARMWASRYAGAKDYIWMINPDTFPQLLTLSIGNQPVFLPAGGLGGLPYGTIFGRPVLETEYNKPVGTLGDIMLVSPSQYLMISKGGIKSASSMHVKFVSDQSAYRFTHRVDGMPAWVSSVAKYSASTDYVSPYVGLVAST